MLHADEDLRVLLFITCAQYMALPLLSWSCWEEDGSFKHLIWNEIFYVFEKSLSLLQFKVAREPEQAPRKCSQTLNELFGKDFSLHSKDTTVNNRSVEVQFDYNCDQTQFLAVADAHGVLCNELIEKLACLFDVFLIHSDHDSKLQLQETLSVIKKNQNAKIIVLVHDNSAASDKFQNIDSVRTLHVKSLASLSGNQLQHFLSQLQSEVREFHELDASHYKRYFH